MFHGISLYFNMFFPKSLAQEYHPLPPIILQLSFYIQCLFLGVLVTAPSPRFIIAPVCPLKSSCVLYDASTHNFTIYIESTLMLRFICFIPLRYFKYLFNFIHSSSYGFFTLAVKNATIFCISLLHLCTIYNIFAVV